MRNVQLELPFLTPARARSLDQLRVFLRWCEEDALAAGRTRRAAEARELHDQVVAMLDENAAAVLADHPAHQSALTASRRLSGLAGQAHSTDIEHPERSQ